MSGVAVQLDPETEVIAERGALRRGAARWVGKGFWGVLDMGLFAGGNFLTHVFLARWLPETVYGAFTTAFAIYLLGAVVHTSVLIEPMMVYGAQRYRRRLPAYLGELVRMHARLCALYALILVGIASVQIARGETQLAGALFMFAAAQFTLLLPWVLRDACYLEADPKPAGIAGIIYVGCVLLGLFALRTLGWLSLPAAVGVLGGAALIASAWLVSQLELWPALWHTARRWRHARARHWRFGRWALTTNFVRYVPEHLPLIVVPVALGYASGGALKALINLITPFVLVTWAFSLLMMPVLVRRRGTADFERFAVGVALLVAAGPLLCWPLLGGLSELVVGWLYDGKFVDTAWVLWILGALPVVVSVNCIVFAMFRALDKPELLLPGAVAAAAVIVVAGFPAMWWYGLPGMVAGMVAAQATQGVVQVVIYTRRLRREAIGAGRETRKPTSGVAPASGVDPTPGAVPVVQELVS